MKHLLWPLVTVAALLTACNSYEKRYEEGPLISLMPVEDRVVNTWIWAFYGENGENRSGEYADSTLELSADRVVRICGGSDSCREGSWRLISKNRELQLIFGEEAIAYNIQLLKRDEMWLEFASADSALARSWQLISAE